jgi:CubicO group peptidase (beta-lactamase class C family)
MPNPNPLSAASKSRIEKYVASAMRKNNLPGLSLCLVKDGEVVYARGFGSRSLEPPKPSTPETLYGIGSVSKAFTAVSVLKLAEQGKVALEDPLNKYLPNFTADSGGSPVTVHQLLSHSSGFPDLGVAEEVIGKIFGMKTTWTPLGGVDDLLSLVNASSSERVSDKGDVFFYWNEGYALLGALIEKVSGQTYPDFVRNNVLAPLKMTRSTFDRNELEKDEDSMTGYVPEKEGKRKPQKFPSHPLVDAAGGLMSSAKELSHFVTMCIDNGKFEGTQVIDSKLLSKAFTPHIRHSLPPAMVGGEFYGYGFIINKDFHGHTLIGHGGNVGVSSAYIGFIPELRAGVSLVSNADFGSDTPALYALCVLCGIDPEKALISVAYEKRAEILKGRYESSNGAHKMTILEKVPVLSVEVGGEEGGALALPLILEGEDVYILWGPERSKLRVDIHSPDKVDVFIERNVFHKVGKWP